MSQAGASATGMGRALRTLLAIGVLVVLASLGRMAWVDHGEARVAAELQARLRPGDLRMISSETCIYCARARDWLRARDLPFEECFVERDEACAAQYRALGAPGTPTLLVRGKPQLGFRPQRIAAALASR